MDATFKTVWLSDVHLGSRACRVQLLLDFLRQTRCETLYLVGDIIDLESCTALVERHDGALELKTWRSQAALAPIGESLRDAA